MKREVAEMWRRAEAIVAALKKEMERSGARSQLLYVPARALLDEALRIAGG